MWKDEKFSLTEKKIVKSKSLVKTLLSRNFCEKSVRENLWNFHFDFSFFYTSHCETFTATILSQKFRQSTFTLLSKLIWRKNFRGSEFWFFHTVLDTRCLPKSLRVNFRNFHSGCVSHFKEIRENNLHCNVTIVTLLIK